MGVGGGLDGPCASRRMMANRSTPFESRINQMWNSYVLARSLMRARLQNARQRESGVNCQSQLHHAH